MDLLDFEAKDLYFEEEDSPEVEALIQQAGNNYSDGSAELPLLQAFLRAPDSFNVLVALNRFYYYQHRLDEALVISKRFLHLVCQRVALPENWEELEVSLVSELPKEQLQWVRLYLFTLKSIGFLNMRLFRLDISKDIFERLVEIDTEDRIGVKPLLSLVKARQMEDKGLYPIHPMKMA